MHLKTDGGFHKFQQTGTLDLLIALSEDLPKQDTFFTATVAKTVDTLRNLLNNDPSKLSQHILVDEKSVDTYLLGGWKWNEGRYGVQKSLREIVDTLVKVCSWSRTAQPPCSHVGMQEMNSLDNALKAKLNNYNLVKGSLTQMQRKKTYLHRAMLLFWPISRWYHNSGNLSVRSLADVVSSEDFIQESEYLETLLVAVPKSVLSYRCGRFINRSEEPSQRTGIRNTSG